MCPSPIAYRRLLPDLLGACHAFLCTASHRSPTPTARNLQKPVITNDRPANLRCLKPNFDELTARLAGRAARKNTWQSWAHDTSRICHAIVANIYWLGLVTVAVVKGTPRLQGPDTGKRASGAHPPQLASLAWSFAGSELSRCRAIDTYDEVGT